jgi:hypothetical protein
MKTLTIVCASFLLGITCVAQEFAPGDMRAANLRLNFSVPDAPAFTILNYTPSVIIRPTSVREVGLAVADFIRGGSVLPKAFAAEFSPGLLVGGNTLTIRQYNENPFWYRTRISVASRSFDDNTGRVQASLGVRLTLTDEADPRTDREFVQGLTNLAVSINQAIAEKVQIAPPTETGPVKVESADVDALEQEIVRLREKQRDERWNANIAELAAAVRFGSRDSLARNAVADKYQAWLAGSFHVSQWGQFIFNLSGSIERSAAFRMDSTSIAMNSRFYFGTNSIKVFGEGQITALERSPALYLFNIGGEMNPISSFWLEFSAGFEKRGADPAIIRTMFHIRWSLPEIFIPGI